MLETLPKKEKTKHINRFKFQQFCFNSNNTRPLSVCNVFVVIKYWVWTHSLKIYYYTFEHVLFNWESDWITEDRVENSLYSN
jgi:hypothetical protein